jgi:hypothetical protein
MTDLTRDFGDRAGNGYSVILDVIMERDKSDESSTG